MTEFACSASPLDAPLGGSSAKIFLRRLGLTPKDFIAQCFIERSLRDSGGVSPMYEEIAASFGSTSKGTASRALDRLEAAGFIRRTPDRKQGIEVLRSVLPPDPSVQDIYAACIARDGPPKQIKCGVVS